MKNPREKLEALEDALDDAASEDPKAVVEALGVDVPALAAKLRAKVAEADRKERFAAASIAYAEELARLELQKHAPRSREDQLGKMKRLLARVPKEQIAMHFLKYESATDEELAELVRSLEHLLGREDDDGENE